MSLSPRVRQEVGLRSRCLNEQASMMIGDPTVVTVEKLTMLQKYL